MGLKYHSDRSRKGEREHKIVCRIDKKGMMMMRCLREEIFDNI
jgi:hypothetical protein